MIFFTKNPNLKKKNFSWGGGGGARVSDFLQRIKIQNLVFFSFFLRGGGGGVDRGIE